MLIFLLIWFSVEHNSAFNHKLFVLKQRFILPFIGESLNLDEANHLQGS